MSDKWTNARQMLTKYPHLHLDNTQCMELLDERDRLAQEVLLTQGTLNAQKSYIDSLERDIEVLKNVITTLTSMRHGGKYLEEAEHILKGEE